MKFTVHKIIVFESILQELVRHTAEAPHVWGLVVLIFNYYDFGRPIPSGAHMYRTRPFHTRSSIIIILQNGSHFSLEISRLSPLSLVFFDPFLDQWPYYLRIQIILILKLPRYGPSQPEITYFDLAILRQQQICRFDISMHYVCFVQECHCAEGMIQDL